MKLKYNYFAIDFDGTIAYDAYPGIGDLIPGAKETMAKIRELGGKIVIWTCRTHEAREEAIKFLADNGIEYDKFNEPFDENVNEYGGDHARKVFADVYIDDRCVLFKEGGFVNWNMVKEAIFDYSDEKFEVGDVIECIKYIPGGIRPGERFIISSRVNSLHLIDYIIGPMATNNLDGLEEFFKKVK